MANDLNKLLSGVEDVNDNAIYENYAKQFALASKDAELFFKFVSQLSQQYNLAELQATAQNANASKEERIQAEQELAAAKEQIAAQSAKAVQNINKATYRESSSAQRAEIHKNNKLQIKERQKAASEEYKQQYELAKAQGKKGKELAAITRAHTAEQKKLKKDLDKETLAQIDNERAARKEAQQQNAAELAAQDAKRKADTKAVWEEFKSGSAEGIKGMAKLGAGYLGAIGNFSIDGIADNLTKKAKDTKKELETVKNEKAELEALDSDDPEILARIEELNKEEAELQKKAIVEANTSAIAQTAAKVAAAVASEYNKQFTAAESFLTSNSALITSRLDGTNETFNSLTDTITKKLSVSPYVKVTDVLNNMKKAVEEGIAYNVESRAFLGTIADKIAHTFNAFDSNLTRLIKLQQQDSTAARLGMEAALNKFFNKQFSDSSYLNRLSDSISGAILEANSQLNRNASTEFEYIVHKWMGSLSSVGFSDETLTTIAEGINYLATGDVQNLSSNTQLQNLLAMSASQANLEYSELLLNGLDAEKTNQLFEGMVKYLQQIAQNTDNQVVKAAYGDIFNLSLSDMTALNNLGDISSIANNRLSYDKMISTTQNKLDNLSEIVTVPEMLSNIYSNVIYSVASDMVNNPATWAMTKMLEYLDDPKGGKGADINIPFISAAGFGVDINSSVIGLMKMGLGIAQGFSLVSNIVEGLSSSGGTDLEDWGIEERISRGSGGGFQLSTLLGGTSNSTSYSTNMNQEDVTNSSLNQATDDAEESKEITNKNRPEETQNTMDDLLKMVVGEDAESFIRSRDYYMEAAFLSSSNAIHTWDTHLKRISANTTSNDYLATHDPLMLQGIQAIFGTNALFGAAGSANDTVLYVYDNNANTHLTNISNNLDVALSTLFGKSSLLGDDGVLKVSMSNLDSMTDILSLFSTDTSDSASSGPINGYVQVINDYANPVIVYLKNFEDISSELEVQSGTTTVEIDTTKITDAFKKALGVSGDNNSQDLVLATQIADAIANKDLRIKNMPGDNLNVKISNLPTNAKF